MNMNRKTFVLAVIIAVMSTAGVAGSSDNSTNTSYFEGVWSGSWELGQGPGSLRQDVTITIGNKNEKGAHKTTYAWGWGKSGTGGAVSPGSFAVYGREQDGVFRFWWKDKEGTKKSVTLEKNKEDVVKARLEREGPSTSMQKPYNETYLKRK